MKTLDIRGIIADVRKTVDSHELKKGQYARWIRQNEKNDRNLGISEYGCADAANILYTINDFYCDDETRKARIDGLKSLQDSKTGLFSEPTHHPYHTTAHCIAALQLFDEKPIYPLKSLHPYLEKENLYSLLDGLDWQCDPWPESHKGAGVYAALVNAGEETEKFCEYYFDWFRENADSVTGFWKKGYSDKAPYSEKRNVGNHSSVYPYMAAGFHYLFNHEYAKMPLVYPDKVIDSCIKMYEDGALPLSFLKSFGFIEIDWLYCIHRASRQTTHKNEKVKALIYDFAQRMTGFLTDTDFESDDGANDLHMLFGTVCALAEMQQALPGIVKTEKPLRLVLDRRPFI